MREMVERRDGYQSAVGSLQSALGSLGLRRRRRPNPVHEVSGRQFEAPTQAESRTRSVGEEAQSRTGEVSGRQSGK